jgi:hypothetical protein
MDALVDACEKDFPEVVESPPPVSTVTSNPRVTEPTPDQRLVVPPVVPDKAELDALRLKDNTGSCYLYGSLAPLFGAQFDQLAYRSYLNRLLHDAGNPTDPLERMMIEQLALSHHAIGRLHVKAAASKSEHETSVYNASAARLMSEYRHSVLALKNYRAPTSPGSVTVMRVHQQNVAVGDQQVALVEGPKNRGSKVLNLPAKPAQSDAPAPEHHGEKKSEP